MKKKIKKKNSSPLFGDFWVLILKKKIGTQKIMVIFFLKNYDFFLQLKYHFRFFLYLKNWFLIFCSKCTSSPRVGWCAQPAESVSVQ